MEKIKTPAKTKQQGGIIVMGHLIDLEGLSEKQIKAIEELVRTLKEEWQSKAFLKEGVGEGKVKKVRRKPLRTTVWKDMRLLNYPLTREQIYEDI